MLARYFLLSSFTLLLFACGSGNDAKTDGGSDVDVPDGSTECTGQDDGKPCGVDRICLSEVCQDSVCGDGYVDALIGEECEDGNLTDGDGCDNDCSLSCQIDEDCSDGTMCSGIETCISVANGKRCQAGTPLDCTPADPNPCTDYVCHPDDGCDEAHYVQAAFCYRDADGDGYPDPDDTIPTTGLCDCDVAGYIRKRQDNLWDCNDARDDVRPGQATFTKRPHCPGQFPLATEDKDCTNPNDCERFSCANDATPSFDFNCDGEESFRYADNASACQKDALLGTCVGSGWQAAPAPCGFNGSWINCSGTLACAANSTTRQQECR
jgi:cysteine-rich repeat protein